MSSLALMFSRSRCRRPVGSVGDRLSWWVVAVLTICSRDFVGDLTGDPVLNVRRTLLGTAAAG